MFGKKQKEKLTSINKVRTTAIQDIEETLTKKGIKIEELDEKYRNYQDQINNLNKSWKIQSLVEDIIDSICKLGRKKDQNTSEFISKNKQERKGVRDKKTDKSDNDKSSVSKQNDNQKVDFNKLSRKELIDKINQKDLKNDSLKEIISALEKRISELEEEIKELKSEKYQTSQIQQEIHKRNNYLQEARNNLEKLNALNNRNPAGDSGNKSGNNFPTGWVVGGGILVVVGLTILFIIKSRKKRKSNK